MHMVMFVLDNPQLLDDILGAWREVGVSGATIVETTGAHRHEAKRIGGRYFMGLGQPAHVIDEDHFTLFAIVHGETIVQELLDATESITGDLNDPNTGVFAAWPLTVAKGVPTIPDQKDE
jgi:hypothetical protein